MMIKKHVLIHKVIFFQEDFFEFDYNMISNSNISNLQSFQELQLVENLTLHINVLYFKVYADCNSLYDLIKLKQLSLNMLKTLLGQIDLLEKELESYLLDINKVNFDPAYLIFDEVSQSFLFRYLPCKNLSFSYDLLALFRFIAYETPWIDLELLQDDTDFSLSKLKEHTSLKAPGTHYRKQNKNWYDTFKWRHKTKKEKEATSNSIQNTTQRMNYPMLFDKLNPDQSMKVYFDHNIIGREETCNIRINDHSVSRQHAQLIHIKNNFKLIDLNSTNGTFVNREPIAEKMVVNGDIIQIGNKEFIFIR